MRAYTLIRAETTYNCTSTYIHIHIYTYTYIHIYIYIHIYTYTYIHISICMYIDIFIYIYTCKNMWGSKILVIPKTCAHTLNRAEMTYIYIYICTCMHLKYMCTEIYIYMSLKRERKQFISAKIIHTDQNLIDLLPYVILTPCSSHVKYIYTHIYVHVYLHVYIYTYMYICMYTWIYVYM